MKRGVKPNETKYKKYMRDSQFSKKMVLLLFTQLEPYWIAYINEKYFDSYGCPPPKLLSESSREMENEVFRASDTQICFLLRCLLFKKELFD